MNLGWIKLHRDIKSNWLYTKKPYDELHAWIDLLLTVNHEPKKVVLGKSLVFVGRGSTITSIRKLSERWGWSNTKIRTFFDLLISDGMIKVESDTKKTLVTVANYEKYQFSETPKRQQNDTETTQKHTNNNEKNNKNEKELSLYIYGNKENENVENFVFNAVDKVNGVYIDADGNKFVHPDEPITITRG
jgi:DNA replication protein DnaD